MDQRRGGKKGGETEPEVIGDFGGATPGGAPKAPRRWATPTARLDSALRRLPGPQQQARLRHRQRSRCRPTSRAKGRSAKTSSKPSWWTASSPCDTNGLCEHDPVRQPEYCRSYAL